MKKYKLYILTFSIVLIVAIIWNTINESGIKDLKGNFKELVFIRNEQNTGPVIRIYAVSLDNENWDEMMQYGNYMPHNKYGSTKIYFFLNNTVTPNSLIFGDVNIDDRLKKYCIAIYEKDGMSQTSLRRHPFKQ